MNKNKPHSLEMELTIERDKPIKFKPSELEGYIVLRDNVRLPMRSYVRQFLDKMRGVFAKSPTGAGSIVRPSIASKPGSTAVTNASQWTGVQVGRGGGAVQITQTELIQQYCEEEGNAVAYGDTTITAPTASGLNVIKTSVKRSFTNNDSQITLQEVGLKLLSVSKFALQNTFSVSYPVGYENKANAKLIARDIVTETFSNTEMKQVEYLFLINTSTDGTGGMLKNMASFIYNYFFKANYNAQKLLDYSGVEVTYAPASFLSATNFALPASVTPFQVNGIASQPFGIVLGTYDPTGQDADFTVYADGEVPEFEIGIQSTNVEMNVKTSGLSYGANTISAVTLTGTDQAYFTISRTITNSGTSTQVFNRVGLLTKGTPTTDTALGVGQCVLAMNTLNTNLGVMHLAPSQSIKVTYRFSVSV